MKTLVERYALPPAEIEQRSLAYVEAGLRDRFADAGERRVAGRICYAAGDLALADAIRFSPGAVASGMAALSAGAALFVDVRMVAAGLDRARQAALGCELLCAIDTPGALSRAKASGLPRAVEAVRLLAPQLDGAVCVIGNAPTALLALLDLCDQDSVRPALVIGMPVGFVAAAESKDELMARGLPFVTITGARGGSPLAAAATNALLRLASAAPGAQP
jgi:precorrin-8X/cobalt-precorrin-8 methylmutase